MSPHVSGALLIVLVASVCSVDLNVYPAGFWVVREDTDHTLTISLNYNTSDPNDAVLNYTGSGLTVKVIPDEDWKLDFVNDSVYFTADEIANVSNKSIVFSGFYWQRTQLSFYLLVDSGNDPEIDDLNINGTLLRDDVVVGVTRAQAVVDKIFVTFITLFLTANTINMGCQLNLRIILECIRKPLGPLCGFLSQFLVMPLFSYGVGYLLFKDPLFRLGLFTLGCSPGGVMSNFWTLVFDGDLNLSITMTFVSTICAMGMMPFWMFTLGNTIFEDGNGFQIPFKNLAISLVGLTVPLAIGFFIQKKLPRWADRLSRIIKPFTLSFIVVFLTLGTYTNFKAYMLMNWQMFAAGFIVAIAGFSLGAVFGASFCLARNQIIAISIETALQNVGVAFIVLRLSLPTPEGEIGSLPVLAQAMLTGMGLNALFWIWTISKRLCCRKPAKLEEKPAQTDIRKDPEEVHSLFKDNQNYVKKDPEVVRSSLKESNLC